MALCMQLVCFDRRPLLSLIGFLVGITAFGLPLLVNVGAAAESQWRSGVFPIVHFEGYTSHFGHRLGLSGREELHTGLDIAAPLGSPVLSWWSGEVLETIDDSICGLGVVIVSGDYEHIYCHLQQQFLQRGEKVRGGQPIGKVGVTGRSSGPHLHWGIRYRGRWLNPGLILRAMVISQ
ncbi:MAG: M23 family metallopeptidase [Prochlorococcus sp.]